MAQAQDPFPRQKEREVAGGQTGTQNIGGSRPDIGSGNDAGPGSDATPVVLACIEALNREDFDAARKYMRDELSFEGVLGSRKGADAYMDDMKRMRLKYGVQKVFTNGDDVCLFSDLKISGRTILCCSWYHVTGGKIDSLRVVFDPRPILEPSQKH
jgi:SnoaL-like domain